MRREAYELLVESDACKEYRRTDEQWRDMVTRLLIILAETKSNSADLIEFFGGKMKFTLDKDKVQALPNPLDHPPFDLDFFLKDH